MSETIQVSLDPAETNSLTAFATVGYVLSQIAALQVSFDAAINGESNFTPATLATLPGNASMTLSDSLLAIIGGVPSRISAADFLADVGTTAQSLPLSTNAVAGTDYFISIQSNVVCLQQAATISTYVLGTLSAATKGVVELTESTALDSSVHNNKILVCSQPIEISQGVAWVGSGITAKIVNVSSGPVTFSSGITLSSGVSALQPGQSADLQTFTYSDGNVYFVTINGASTLTSTGVTVTIPYSAGQINAPVDVSGQVYPANSALQVALSKSPTVMPTSGWVSAQANGTTYNASLTPTSAGTYYVWARLSSNNAIYSVSSAITIAASTITITTGPSYVSSGQAFPVVGTVSPAGSPVIVGMSVSQTTPPTVWQNATVRGNAWGASLTSVQNGEFYVWAELAANTSVNAVTEYPFTNNTGNAGVAVSSATGQVLTSGTISVAGTVGDSNATVQVGLSTSSTTAPSSWVNASVVGTNWTASLTESVAGTYYVWAQETSPRTSSSVYYSPVVVSNPTTGVVITSYPASQVAYTSLTVTGTVSDENATVKVGYSQSNTAAPGSTGAGINEPYSNATVVGLVWSATLYIPFTGSYYIWAQETTPNLGVTVSSTPFTVSAPGIGFTLVPLPSTGITGNSLSFEGTIGVASGDVQPANGQVYAAVSTSNTTMPPLTNFVYVTTNGISDNTAYGNGNYGNFFGSLTLGTPGSYYLWLIYVPISGSSAPLTSGNIIYSAVSSTSVLVSAAQGNLAITTFPANATQNVAFAVGGTVGDSGATVQVGLSTSATTAPSSYVNATVSGNAWSYSFSEATTGTYYLWVKEITPSIASIVSSTTVVVSASIPAVVITSFASPVSTGAAIAVAGTCESGATINVGLSTSNTTPPSSYNAATVSGTSWSASLSSSTAGTYYVWAQETAPHTQQAVSSTQVTVNAASSQLSYALVSGSGNGGLVGMTFNTTASGLPVSASNWQTPLAVGSSYTPCIQFNQGTNTTTQQDAVRSTVFYLDTNTTATLPSSGGQASSAVFYNNYVFYGYSLTAPSAGTYYGKFAFYDVNNVLLGVVVTSAVSVS